MESGGMGSSGSQKASIPGSNALENGARSYCTCDPASIICNRCFACHLKEVFGTKPNVATPFREVDI